MGLIFNRSGHITERTRWNLSMSGVSLSHKRGRLTLNTRGRSNFRLANGFNIRVHTVLAYVLWVLFFLWDFIVLLVGGLIWLMVAAVEGVYYGGKWLADLPKDRKLEKEAKENEPEVKTEPTVESLSLNMRMEGTYDLRTLDGKLYEVILRGAHRPGVLALDDEFGAKSFHANRPFYPLYDLTVTEGVKGRFLIERKPEKLSTVYTSKIIEIIKVA